MSIDEDRLNDCFTQVVKQLSKLVRVSEDKTEVVFLDKSFPENLQDSLKYIFELSNLEQDDECEWFHRPIFKGVTKLVADNISGFNSDKRSHRNDYVTAEQGVYRMRLVDRPIEDTYKNTDILNYIDDDWIESDDDGCYGRGNLKVAQTCRSDDVATYTPEYILTKSTEITFGDIMYAFMACKGSKTDFWYELFMDCDVYIEGDIVHVSFDFEHGS